MNKESVLLAVLIVLPFGASAQFYGPRLNSLYPKESVYKGYQESGKGLGFSIGPDIFNSDAPPEQAAPLNVLGGERIEKAGYNSAAEGLNMLPGIFTKKTNAFGRADIEIRGLGDNGRRINVMVDGRPEKMSLYGCAVTHTLPLNNIERVEVVEGPASALYGSGALGGAVNIITHGAKKAFEAEVSARYGSFNTQIFGIRGGAAQGKNSLYASFQKQSSDGFGKDNGYEGNDFTVEYGRKINDEIKVFIRNKTFTGTQRDDRPVDMAPGPGTWFDYRRGANDISAAYEKDNINLSLRAFNLYGRHVFWDGWRSQDSTYGLMAKGSYTFDNEAAVNLGAEQFWMEAERESGTPGKWNRQEYGLYTSGKLPVSKYALLEGALRLTGDSETENYWAPMAALAVKPFNFVELYGTVSKGIRFAQISELYAMPVSNPGLKPEKVWGYETGLKFNLFYDSLYARAAVYRMDGENLIAVYNGQFNNVGDFEFKGFLADVKYNITQELSAGLNYNYQDSGINTQGRPGQMTAAVLEFDTKKFGFTADLKYIADYYKSNDSQDRINDIFTLNAGVWYNLSDDIQLFAGGNNLTDRDYVIFATNTSHQGLFQMPGITVYGGVKITI